MSACVHLQQTPFPARCVPEPSFGTAHDVGCCSHFIPNALTLLALRD